MIVKNLMGTGVPAAQATANAGLLQTGLTALGSSQGTALAAPSDLMVFTTTAASTGVILPAANNPGDEYTVANYGASTLSVYPPTGGKIQNAAANAAFSVATNKTAKFVAVSATDFAAVLSA